jgi:hypothetical protein
MDLCIWRCSRSITKKKAYEVCMYLFLSVEEVAKDLVARKIRRSRRTSEARECGGEKLKVFVDVSLSFSHVLVCYESRLHFLCPCFILDLPVSIGVLTWLYDGSDASLETGWTIEETSRECDPALQVQRTTSNRLHLIVNTASTRTKQSHPTAT